MLELANNCFLGCELHKKTILSLNSTIFHPLFRVFGKIVLILSDHPYFWKDLLISKLKNLSIQLSVRFFLLYSVFNEHSFAPRRPDHAIKKLITRFSSAGCFVRSMRGALVGPSGLEPPTSCLSGTRSNLLSYEPISLCSLSIPLFEKGVGPSTFSFLGAATCGWWR